MRKEGDPGGLATPARSVARPRARRSARRAGCALRRARTQRQGIPKAERGQFRSMAYLINCDCGYVSRGETEDELVDEANQHIDEVHPDMAGKVSRDDLLAMAEEV